MPGTDTPRMVLCAYALAPRCAVRSERVWCYLSARCAVLSERIYAYKQGGSFEANPPFMEESMQLMYDVIHQLLLQVPATDPPHPGYSPSIWTLDLLYRPLTMNIDPHVRRYPPGPPPDGKDVRTHLLYSRRPVLDRSAPYVLPGTDIAVWSAMSGTDIAYGSRCPVLTQRMARGVRY
eukprot:2306427-Rhodomonas_salina.1